MQKQYEKKQQLWPPAVYLIRFTVLAIITSRHGLAARGPLCRGEHKRPPPRPWRVPANYPSPFPAPLAYARLGLSLVAKPRVALGRDGEENTKHKITYRP